MYDARAIANFFIDRAGQQRLPLTVMTLLKVLYFSHGWHLAKYSKPLIGQPFEAWKYGPVSRVVYDQFKGYSKKTIDKKTVSFDPSLLKFVETPYDLDQSTSEFLGNIFDYYAKFHSFALSELTHEEGGPWHQVWMSAQERAVPGMLIPHELILSWFQNGRSAV